MSDLKLTKEERELFAAMAQDRHGPFSRLTFYATTIGPCIVFAIVGVLRKDFVALLVAFCGLLGFLVWRINSELERLELYKSACRKIVEHTSETPPT